MIRRCPIRFGLGIVENQNEQPALVRAIPAGEIETEEAKLLRQAKAKLAKIPFAEVDLLIVDRMGKDISGIGMEEARRSQRLKVNTSGSKLEFDAQGNMKSCFADGRKSKISNAMMEEKTDADRFVW